MILSPLEQFEVISILPLNLIILDFSITNVVIMSLCILFSLHIIIFFISYTNKQDLNKYYFLMIPVHGQLIFEQSNKVATKLLFDNVNVAGERFFPFVFAIFSFILICNLSGLIPYSFTITSHLVITFILSFSIFIGINIIGFKKHSFKLLSLIIPANSNLLLALVLVPIEFISYLAKPISLGVRLFINLMAGHTLLKVIVGFAWGLIFSKNIVFLIIHIVPIILLVVLMLLELCVALMQAYVFIILTCIYLNDSINLH